MAVRTLADWRCLWTRFVKPRRLSHSSPGLSGILAGAAVTGSVPCFVSGSFALGIRSTNLRGHSRSNLNAKRHGYENMHFVQVPRCHALSTFLAPQGLALRSAG